MLDPEGGDEATHPVPRGEPGRDHRAAARRGGARDRGGDPACEPAGRLRVRDAPGGSSLDLLRALRDVKPTIVHFAGHATTDGVYLIDDQGQPAQVTRETLLATFDAAGQSVKIVGSLAEVEDDARRLVTLRTWGHPQARRGSGWNAARCVLGRSGEGWKRDTHETPSVVGLLAPRFTAIAELEVLADAGRAARLRRWMGSRSRSSSATGARSLDGRRIRRRALVRGRARRSALRAIRSSKKRELADLVDVLTGPWRNPTSSHTCILSAHFATFGDAGVHGDA
jgi:hypothetical protein